MNFPIAVPESMYNGLCVHAEKCWPSEAVAIIGAKDKTAEVATFLPVPNRSPNPRNTFFIEPFEMWKAAQALHGERMYPAAIFHSHPSTPGVPSEADVTFAFEFPLMLIAERQGEPGWAVRAWCVTDKIAREVGVTTQMEAIA